MFKKNEDKPQFSEGIKKELKENGEVKKINFDKKKLIWVFVTIALMILLIIILWKSYSFDRKAETEDQDIVPYATEEKPAGVSEEEQSQESYTVVEGDTLSTIAEKFNIGWQKLAEANNLTEESTLRIGQKLIIPK